jgi:hypothetical protein
VVRKRGNATCRRDADTPLDHGFPMDQAHSFTECRVMHRTASAHRLERVTEAKNAELYTTLHTF